jgi:hypothetical protein
MKPGQSSPVQVEAVLDPGLRRWMWLVKWFLAIPHYVVLFFLGIAFFFVTIIAFFAILFTARYPRALFNFNVGVMRWHWRVSYYAIGVLGTDRYPPFTLADVPDYPARLNIAYPERLSRGLVLIKWWLLTIPHYFVISAVTGMMWWSSKHHDSPQGGLNLVLMLALFAAVTLLFAGRYPRGIFDLLVGAYRWSLRVGAYAALLTDSSPPLPAQRSLAGAPSRRRI